MKLKVLYILLFASILAVSFNDGCSTTSGGTLDSKVVGSWRILSETIFYDGGGSQSITPVTTLLVLSSGGTWTFGSSSGSASVASITSADWTYWGTADYGPTQKIVLNGWSSSNQGYGPIEESSGTVNYIWVIYPTTSEVYGTGKVWLKFGTSS